MTIDHYDSGTMDSNKDIIIYFTNQRVATKMAKFAQASNGVMYYGDIELSIQVNGYEINLVNYYYIGQILQYNA